MYKVDDKYKECTVYTKTKKFKLCDATQKELKSLFDRGHPGLRYIEKKKKTE